MNIVTTKVIKSIINLHTLSPVKDFSSLKLIIKMTTIKILIIKTNNIKNKYKNSVNDKNSNIVTTTYLFYIYLKVFI